MARTPSYGGVVAAPGYVSRRRQPLSALTGVSGGDVDLRDVSSGVKTQEPKSAALKPEDYARAQRYQDETGAAAPTSEPDRESRLLDVVDELAAFAGALGGAPDQVETARYHQLLRRQQRTDTQMRDFYAQAGEVLLREKAEEESQKMRLEAAKLAAGAMGEPWAGPTNLADLQNAFLAAVGKGDTSLMQQLLPQLDAAQAEGRKTTSREKAQYGVDQERAGFDVQQTGRKAGAEAYSRESAQNKFEMGHLDDLRARTDAKTQRSQGERALGADKFLDRYDRLEKLVGNPVNTEAYDEQTGAKTTTRTKDYSPDDEAKLGQLAEQAARELVAMAGRNPKELREDRVLTLLDRLMTRRPELAIDYGQRFLALAHKSGNQALADAIRQAFPEE